MNYDAYAVLFLSGEVSVLQYRKSLLGCDSANSKSR